MIELQRLANIRKHGIDFIDVEAVFEGDTVTVEMTLLIMEKSVLLHLD